MRALPASAHAPISNRGQSVPPKRFMSREPNFGQGARHPAHPDGFEAIDGFRIKPPATRKKPRVRSIRELTYGSRSFKLQTGKASNSQTQIGDTSLYPWRVNCLLKITVPGKTEAFLGTGWFIGPYAVITAAHAVYPREPGIYVGWASQIEVITGANGSGKPVHDPITSSLFYCPDGWQSDGDLRLDYGAIILNQGIGSEVGFYGYATYSDSDLLSSVANLSGYPQLKPDQTPANGTQWYAAGNVGSVDESFVYYYLDAESGESGSCVYRNIGDQSYAMAIHVASQGSDPSTALDRGLRITEPVFENLQHWSSLTG
jgi:glutamyl endopeptidase